MKKSVNFDRASEFYDRTRAFPAGVDTQIAAFIAESAGLQPDHHVLEVGIGTGRIGVPLAPLVGMMSGVDISTQMLRTLLAKSGGERVQATQVDAHHLPFDRSTFDGVLMVHVLHLVAQPERVIDEIQRVLKTNAPLIHCMTRSGKDDDAVTRTWNLHRPKHPTRKSREDVGDLLAKYLPEPQERLWTYTTNETPRFILEAIRNRYWSSIWDFSDEELAPAIQAIEQVVAEQYDGDYDAPLQRTTHFAVQVYTPYQ